MNHRTRLLVPLVLVLLLLLGAALLAIFAPPGSDPDAPESRVPVPGAAARESVTSDRVRVKAADPRGDRGAAGTVAGATDALDVDGEPTHVIDVTVLDPTGAPAVGVIVRIMDRTSTLNIEIPDSMWLADGRTDAVGRCRLEITQGHGFKVVAYRDGLAGVIGNLSVRGEAALAVEVRLRHAPVIRGRVVDPDGAAVAGIRVGGWFQTPPLSHWMHVVVATTDADGTFTFDDVPDDHHGRVVEIRALRAPGLWPAVKRIQPADLDREIVIEVLRTTRVMGRFVVRGGGPVRSGHLEVQGDGWVVDLTSDSDGRVDDVVPRGELKLRFFTEQALDWIPSRPRHGSRSQTDLGEIVLEPGSRVAGRVLDAAGTPATGVLVVGDGVTARTDEDGRFVLEHLMERPVELRAVEGNGGRVSGNVARIEVTPPANDVVLRLSAARMLDLRFETPADGSEPGRAQVTMEGEDGSGFHTWAPGRGPRWRFQGPAPGIYRTTITVDGYEPVVLPALGVSASGAVERTIVLRRAEE